MIFKSIQIHAIAIERPNPIANVPCGDCIQCCKSLSPNLTPAEFASGKYVYTLLTSPNQDTPTIAIPRNEDGCYYLKDRKCTIYNDRPLACRQFDCRQNHYPPFKDLVKEKFNIDLPEE